MAVDPTPPSQPAPLFSENGASWYWVLAGPAAAAAMLFIQNSNGGGMQLVVPGIFLVLVSGFVGVQIKAARIHTSVELTAETLRQGTETIRVAEIVGVYPAPKQPGSGRLIEKLQKSEKSEQTEKWQSARALGELTKIPRGRAGIGLRLTGRRTAQAWARNHRGLRTALTSLVRERTGSFGPDADDDDSGPLR
jgi:hypothetical protein